MEPSARFSIELFNTHGFINLKNSEKHNTSEGTEEKIERLCIAEFLENTEKGTRLILIPLKDVTKDQAKRFKDKPPEIAKISPKNKKTGKREITLRNSKKFDEVVFLSKSKRGVEKIRNLAKDQFFIKSMSEDEYNKIRKTVEIQLQTIIDNAKLAKAENEKIPNFVNKLELSQRVHEKTAAKVSNTILLLDGNEVVLRQLVSQKRKHQEAIREKNAEEKDKAAEDRKRRAIERDENKREIRLKEISNQSQRLKTEKSSRNKSKRRKTA